MSILIATLLVASTSALHMVNLRMEKQGRTASASVVNVVVPLSQMVTCIQLCTVMTQISIRWKAPWIKEKKEASRNAGIHLQISYIFLYCT